MVCFFANDPSGVHVKEGKTGALQVAHASTRCIHVVMCFITTGRYLDEGHMIQIDFVSWQRDHPNITCYLSLCNYIMVPAIVEVRYILQISGISRRILYVILTQMAGELQCPLSEQNTLAYILMPLIHHLALCRKQLLRLVSSLQRHLLLMCHLEQISRKSLITTLP